MGMEERSDKQQRVVEQASNHYVVEVVGFRRQTRAYAGKGHVSASN